MKVIVVSLHIAHQPPVHSPILIILGPGGRISSYLKSKYQICKKRLRKMQVLPEKSQAGKTLLKLPWIQEILVKLIYS